MLDKLPVPTDSLYKFMALTGVILFVLPFILIVQLNNHTNDTVIRTILKEDSLQRSTPANGHDSAQVIALKRTREIAISNRIFGTFVAGIVIGGGILLMGYGFLNWKKLVQRHADQIAILEVKLKQTQIDRERYELEMLRRQNPLGGTPLDPDS